MSKAISFAIFGFDEGRKENCFDYFSYLRSLTLNIRLAKLLYPQWEVVIHIDYASHAGHKDFWDSLVEHNICRVIALPKEPLTKAMLWRMKPIFELNPDGFHRYTHTICRDTDSPLGFKERQAVQYWVDHGKVAHAITDSDSHSIPLMGGMIGFSKDFSGRTGWGTWEHMMEGQAYPFEVKGADQDFLNQQVYPKVAQHGNDSITQHYFEGMPKTFLSDYHTCNCPRGTGHADNCTENYKVDLPDEYKVSNTFGGHIGCSGWYESTMFPFLSKFKDQFVSLAKAESKLPEIFYWTKQELF